MEYYTPSYDDSSPIGVLKSLEQLYNETKVGLWSDKGTDHSYIKLYSEILAPYRNRARRVLEIGILGGESLRMWEFYFLNAQVHGSELSTRPIDGMANLEPMIAEGTHNIHIFDATNKIQVDKEFIGMRFNVVIDDASHVLEHQLAIYQNMKPYLAKGAIYIIEDVDKIDEVRSIFENIDKDKKITIYDRRHIKNRFDDVVVTIEDK